MPDRLAKQIDVVQDGGHRRLIIDGEEFPYLIEKDAAVSTVVRPGTMPRVTITLLAEEVTVRDSLNPRLPRETSPSAIREFFGLEMDKRERRKARARRNIADRLGR